MTRRWLPAVLLCGLLATSCGPRPSEVIVDFRHVPHHYTPRDYRDVHQRWTRTALIMKGFDTTLDVAVTYKSYDFRLAYAIHQAAAQRYSAAGQKQLVKQELAPLAKAHEFQVSATATRFEWIDFEKPQSVWRIVLRDDQGHEVTPIEVRKVKMPMARQEAFFPLPRRNRGFRGFFTTYLVRFPTKLPDGTPVAPTSGSKVTLRFAGILGSAELCWRAKAGP